MLGYGIRRSSIISTTHEGVGKDCFDDAQLLQPDELIIGDPILRFDNERQKLIFWNVKLASKWNDLYRIHEAVIEQSTKKGY